MKGPKRDDGLLHDVIFGVNVGAFENDLGRSLLRAWRVGACDEQLAGMIHGLVRPFRTRQAFGTLLPFRAPRLDKGEILLGKDHRGNDIRMVLQWLVAGLLLIANTGGGKTTLLSWIAAQIAATGCRVWLSDFYKVQLRHLRPLFQQAGHHLVILRARDWKYNLLQADASDPRSHLAMVVDLLMRRLGLPPRARTILQQACHALYEQHGIWDGRTGAWPCLFDVYEWVWTTRGLNPPARESILDRLGALLLALTPVCAAYRFAWRPVDLAAHSICFEMRGANAMVRHLLLEPAIYSLLQHKVERGAVNAPMEPRRAGAEVSPVRSHCRGAPPPRLTRRQGSRRAWARRARHQVVGAQDRNGTPGRRFEMRH